MRLDNGRLRLSASDVANFVACGHLTRLDLLRARGEIEPPRAFDVGFEDLVARGEAHEAAVLARFRSAGWSVAEIRQAAGRPTPRGRRGRPSATALMSCARACSWRIRERTVRTCSGARTSSSGPGCSRRLTVNRAPPALHYEVVDAKLARSAKARAVAQIGFYSDLLAGAQGVRPRWMHLALGDGEFTSLKVDRLRGVRTAGPADARGLHRQRPGGEPAVFALPRARGALRHLPVERALHRPQAARRRPVADRGDHGGSSAAR